MNIHPEFETESVRFVCVTDLDREGRRSITSDIEWVITTLSNDNRLRGGDRLLYRNSEGLWDEVLLDQFFEFAGFRPLRAATRNEAIIRALVASGD